MNKENILNLLLSAEHTDKEVRRAQKQFYATRVLYMYATEYGHGGEATTYLSNTANELENLIEDLGKEAELKWASYHKARIEFRISQN